MSSKTIIAITGKAGAGKDTIAAHLMAQYGFQKVAFADPLRDCAAVTFGLPFRFLTEADLKEKALADIVEAYRLPFKDEVSFKIAAREGAIKAFNLTWDEGSVIGSRYNEKLDKFPYITPEELLGKWQDKMWEVFGSYVTGDNVKSLSPRKILQLIGTEVGRTLWKDIWISIWQDRSDQFERVVVTDCRFMNEAAVVRQNGGSVWRVTRPGAETTKESGHISEQEMDRIQVDATLLNDNKVFDLWEKVDATLLAGRAGVSSEAGGAVPPCDDE